MIEIFEKYSEQFKSFEGSLLEVARGADDPYPATLFIDPNGIPYLFRKHDDGSESVRCLGQEALKSYYLEETQDYVKFEGDITVLRFYGYELTINGHVGMEFLG